MLQFLRKLGEYISVDIVGRCGDYSDGQLPSDDQYRLAQLVDTAAYVDGTSRFYFSFENHDCPDYITEKFFNVIRAGKMIPIVMGASKEAYNLFGPEVNIGLVVLDDGWMVLTKMC